jgi:Protein of unknown function (DUF3311)
MRRLRWWKDFWPQLLLLAIPFVWQVGLLPWSNRVEWRPVGLPFVMVWQMLGVLITTASLAAIYHLDGALEEDHQSASSHGPGTGSVDAAVRHPDPDEA